MKVLIVIYCLFINFTTLEAISADPCPGQNSFNQSVMEGFLTDLVWANQRTDSDTESLTVSQITVLDDTGDSSACSSFNAIYQEAFDEKNGLGEPANNITYYEAGNFYFVVITPRQSDNTDYMTFGTSYLHIYKQNLELVKAYAF